MAYTINYQIRKADAMTLYSTVGVAYYDTVVSPNIAEAVKVATARYTAEELVGMRDELANAIELILSEKLEQYNIEVVSTSIEDMDFTDAFTDAVEAKQVAQQNKLRPRPRPSSGSSRPTPRRRSERSRRTPRPMRSWPAPRRRPRPTARFPSR